MRLIALALAFALSLAADTRTPKPSTPSIFTDTGIPVDLTPVPLTPKPIAEQLPPVGSIADRDPRRRVHAGLKRALYVAGGVALGIVVIGLVVLASPSSAPAAH